MALHQRQGRQVIKIALWGSLLFWVIACAERKIDWASPDQGGIPLPSAGGELPSNLFPHPENWSQADSHGDWALKFGPQACFNCHKEENPDLQALSSSPPPGSAPACHSCHKYQPHAKDWVSTHGALVLKEGKQACGTQCHGTDLQGGLSKISCTLCHTFWPHPPQWPSPKKHGKAFLGARLACQSCHGKDLLGGISGVSCLKCHKIYPHPPGYREPSKHGLTMLAFGKVNCGTECHGFNFEGGDSGVSCSGCHEYPHTDLNWVAPETGANHAPRFRQKLREHKESDCQRCHGNNYDRPLGERRCLDCHPAYPHPPGWREKTVHGNFLKMNGLGSCGVTCHGRPDYTGGASGVSCFDCHPGHPDYPHTDPQWVAPGRGAIHAQTFLRRDAAGDPNPCASCHGLNYDTVLNGKTCIGCHPAGITHRRVEGRAWKKEGHGRYFSRIAGLTAISADIPCQRCHGDFVSFSATDTRDSLATRSDCYKTCHDPADPSLKGHGVYPHRVYDGLPWEPVIECNPATNRRNVTGLGHFFLLLGNSPLFVDAAGNPPDRSTPLAAIRASCGGGTEGSCHYEGYRSFQTQDPSSSTCAVLCHGAGTAVTPVPDCATPSEADNGLPPTVTQKTPSPGQENILLDTDVVVRFDKSMRSDTVHRETFTLTKLRDDLTPDGSPLTASVSCSSNWCRTATLNPAARLLRGINYEARLTTAVTDWWGRPLGGVTWRFRTDTTPPSIASRSPETNAIGVSFDLELIAVTFNEPVDPSSVRLNSLLLRTVSGVSVPSWGTFPSSYDCCTNRTIYMTITRPSGRGRHPLNSDTEYRVTVQAGIKDLVGNEMTEQSWTFTTDCYRDYRGRCDEFDE
ncbi:MAG: Ig-like domain-containing protein [Deltaproteobacteria bacterium]|nr:Ig-like domain-containing protein [Deltaproteobacteria bacterium]